MMQQRKYIPDSSIFKTLAALKAASKIRRIGPTKGGSWEVVE